MYEYIDHYKCKHCGNTNCLFKLRRDEYEYKKTGNIKYKSTSTCKLCYLENCRIKNDITYLLYKNKILDQQKLYRINNNKKYNTRARKYYQKRRYKALEQKRNKYIPVEFDGRKNKRIRPSAPKNHPYRIYFGKVNK